MKKAVKWFVLFILAMLLFGFSQAFAEKSGSCGNNASWTLNEETGLLTITGSGEIKSGWGSYIGDIVNVEIQEGITSISSYTFSGCASLRSIIIPSGVTSIGEAAFYGCTALQSMSLPASVTTISCGAFYNCTNCTFYLPDDIAYIHEGNSYSSDMYAYGSFYNCQGKIFCSFGSKTAEQLGKAGYWFFTADNPDVRIKQSKYGEIYASGKNKNAVSVIVPEGVTILDYDAFSGYTAMTSISLPSTLKTVYSRAFDNCSSLKSLTIPSELSGGIGASTGLTSLQYVSAPKGVFAYFDNGKWGSCGDTVYFHIDNDGALTITGSGEMWDVEQTSAPFKSFELSNKTVNVSSVTIAQGITSIGEYAFYNCNGLKEVTIPNSVTRIGKDAFTSCYNLVSISIPDSVIEIGYPFLNKTATIIIPTCNSYAHKWAKDNTNNNIQVEAHQNIVADDAKDATCTEDGLTAGKHCSVCNEVIIQQSTISGGHNYVTDQSIAPTCTETGLTEGKHCSVCGEVFAAQEVIPANGHTEVIDEEITATCTESGLTEGKHCSACNEILVAQEAIPAKGHIEVIDEEISATCTESGLTEGKHCSVCNEILVAQEEIPAKGHTEVIDEAVSATCTESGLTEGKHCSVCNEILVAQELVPTGHKLIKHDKVNATCSEDGVEAYWSCSACNRLFSNEDATEEIDEPLALNSTGHIWIIKSTNTDTGLPEEMQCSICGIEQKIQGDTSSPVPSKSRIDYSFTIEGGGTSKSGYFYDNEYQDFSIPYNCDLSFEVTNTSTQIDGLWSEQKPLIEVGYIVSEELGTFSFSENVRVLHKGNTHTYQMTLLAGNYKLVMGNKYYGTYKVAITGTYLPTVTPLIININTGETYQLTVELCDDLTQEWTSSDEGIAVVKDGLVTGKSGGTAQITCKFNDGTIVPVTVNVAQAVLNSENEMLLVGQQTQLSLDCVSGNPVWWSSDDGIATVDAYGRVTAVHPGKTWIAASFDGNSYFCKVNVFQVFSEGEISDFLWKQFDEVSFQIDPRPRYYSYIVGSNIYTNDYILFEVDEKTNRITSLSLLTDAISGIGKFTLFGTYPGMRYNDAISRLGNYGWSAYKTSGEYVYLSKSSTNNPRLYISVINNALDMIIYIGNNPPQNNDMLSDYDGWIIENGTWKYYKHGEAFINSWLFENNTWYYFDDSGSMVTGWQYISGAWRYFNPSGTMVTGWLQITGNWYYFDTSGGMTTGWQNVDGIWYYFNSSGMMVTGWQELGGTWYFFNTSGVMATGWQEIAGIWYYFDTSGAMATGWIEDGGIWYFLNDDGSWDASATQDNSSQSSTAVGWQEVSGEWFYYENSQAVTGWKSIDGTWYFFDASGAMATGWVSDGGTWYYFKSSGAMVTGWISDGGKWYYFDASGAMTTGWKSISGTWYYFKSSGAMATGWFEDKEAENRMPANQRKALWYWFDNNGQMATGWKEINGQWEMFDNNGVWLYTWDGN